MAAAGVAAHDVAPGKAGRARLRRGGDWDSIGVRELRSQLADARLPIGLSLQLPHAADVAVVEMASSNAGQLGQHGRPPTTSDSENTFASYLEHRRNTRQCQPWVLDKHPKLRQKPGAWCAHCKQSEDLINSPVPPAAPPYPNGSREHAVSWRPDAGVPPHELALEGRSCSRCAADVFLKTRRLRDAAPAGSGGNTPLHHAARSGNLRMLFHLVTLLGLDSLEVGHDRVAEALRKTNERRETALHVAVSVGDRDMVRLLLWVDPRLGQIACHGTSLIYLAVSQGDEDIARQLHDASCPHDADMMSSYSGPSGQNALHAAVLHGKGMTRMVLRFKKDLCTGKDQNGSTPLHFAVSVKQRTYIPRWCFRHTWWQNVLKSFQKRIVNNVPIWPLLETDSSMAYQPDNEGLLPVHVAAITDQTVAVYILLTECSKCMGLRDNKGRTFLHVAVQHKGLSVVRYACRRPECASIMNIPDNDGNTALHLAVVAGNLRMFCDLLTNRQVCLNLKNNKGQTALDLATGQIPQGFFYGRNQDKLIYGTLTRVGAKHSSCRGDKLTFRKDDPGAEAEQKTAVELDKEESSKLTDASRTLAVGSVLIATMTFSATFTRLPGGYITAGAAPALAGTWFFDAFVVSSALAFILASAATVGLMYSGIAMVELPIRRKHFLVSLFFVSSSITCLTTAFALGVYIVLAPVARVTAIVIGGISPLLLIYRNEESLQKLGAVSGPLLARMGFWVWLRWSGGAILLRILKKFWPFAVIFGLAGHL